MNIQLKFFLNILNKHKIKYWVDSGTLLGLIREGDILDHDKDLDIGIHYNNINCFIQLIPKIKLQKYRVRYELYNGIPVKFKMYPQIKEDLRIDINVYKEKENEYLFSPLTCFIEPDGLFFKQYQKIIKFFWRKVFKVIETNKFPYNTVKQTYTWIIPIKYYNNITYNEIFSCYIFKDSESYLKYRYGTWKIPKKQWKLFKDDRGFIKNSPENSEI